MDEWYKPGINAPPSSYIGEAEIIPFQLEASPIALFHGGERYLNIRVEGNPTLTEFARSVYGQDGFENLIENANIIKYSEKRLISGVMVPTFARSLIPGQELLCPSPFPEQPEESVPKGEITDVTVAAQTPEWLEDELATLRQYPEGLVVIIFGRHAMSLKLSDDFGGTIDLEPSSFAGPLTAEEEGDASVQAQYLPRKSWILRNITSMTIKSSLFEGANSMEFSRPINPDDDPDLDIFGNHIMVGFDGELVFAGMLVSPTVDDRKGQTISWVAVSHTYTSLKTHLNPQTHHNEWDKMLPIEIISNISRIVGTPINIAEEEQALLSLPFPDDEGLQNIAYDISTTSPFAVIEKMIASIGRYLCATPDGFFQVVSPSELIGADPVCTLIGEESFAKFTVRYKYEELAHTYAVSAERREYNQADLAKVNGFPLPIFQNVQRKVRPQDSLDGADSWGSGAAVLEMSRAFANALNIDIELPGWKIPGLDRIWRKGDNVKVYSRPHRLYGDNEDKTLTTIVGSFTLEYSENHFRTNLGVFLPGVFDTRLTTYLPYLTRTGESLSFESLGTVQLPENSGDLGDDSGDDSGEEDFDV